MDAGDTQADEADDSPKPDADDSRSLDADDLDVADPADAQLGFWDRISVIALAILTVAWFAILASKLAAVATGGTVAGVVFALALTAAGTAGAARHGSRSSGRLLAGGLFVVGGVATLFSVVLAAGTLPSDAATAIADVAILGGLLVVLALQTDAGRDALAG